MKWYKPLSYTFPVNNSQFFRNDLWLKEKAGLRTKTKDITIIDMLSKIEQRLGVNAQRMERNSCMVTK